MADCTSSIKLGGIAQECLASQGGIKDIYLAQMDDIKGVTVTDASHTVAASAIEMNDNAKFIHYHFAKHQASLTTVTGEANGFKYWESTLAMQFNRMEGKKHLEIQALVTDEIVALVTDYNGVTWLVGGVDGFLTETAGNTTAQTGTALEDNNGYQISLTGRTGKLPYEVTGDFAAIVAEPVNA